MTEKQAAAQANFQQAALNEVYAPKLREKCASIGITFVDEADFTAALETIGMLKMARAQLQAQGIDPTPTPKKEVRDMLKKAMFEQEKAAEKASGLSADTKAAFEQLRAAQAVEAK